MANFRGFAIKCIILHFITKVPYALRGSSAIADRGYSPLKTPTSFSIKLDKKVRTTSCNPHHHSLFITRKSRFLFAVNLAVPCTPISSQSAEIMPPEGARLAYKSVAGDFFTAKRLRFFCVIKRSLKINQMLFSLFYFMSAITTQIVFININST